MRIRSGFEETLALKNSLDRILGPFGGEYGDGVEEEVLMPADRFINPMRASGALLTSRRCSTTYSVGDFVFNYAAQWPDKLPRYAFETLSTPEPSVMGELHLSGQEIWVCDHTPNGLRARVQLVRSEEALDDIVKNRILEVVNDRAMHYSELYAGLVLDLLRS